MKSNKRMQALLSTAMCAAILFSNAAAVFAAEVPPLPRKEGENPLAEQSPVNLLRQPGAASSYQYGEDALYNMSNLDLLGSDVSSLDLDCQKLTDGVKSSAGSIDFDSVVNFYSNSAFNNAENGAKFSNQNTVDFDLGQPKTIVEVNAYSSAGLTGRYAGSLGHIGKYSVYVSADKKPVDLRFGWEKLRRRHFGADWRLCGPVCGFRGQGAGAPRCHRNLRAVCADFV